MPPSPSPELLALLDACAARGIALEAGADGGLKVRAPAGALTAELQAQLKAHKAALIELLRVQATDAASAAPIPKRAAGDGPAPLSSAQARLWFLNQLDPRSIAAYNIVAAVRIRGPLQPVALRSAVQALAARHETLRTAFAAVAGKPEQRIAASVDVPFVEVDLAATLPEAAAREAAVKARLRTEGDAPFDLTRAPLLRTTLLRLAADEHAFLFTVHHLVSDGWSSGVIIRDLAALYAAFAAPPRQPAVQSTDTVPPSTVPTVPTVPPFSLQPFSRSAASAALPPLAAQFADYAAWNAARLASPAAATDLAFWTETLRGTPVLNLATDHPRPPAMTYAGATAVETFPPALAHTLGDLAKREEATLFQVLLTGFVTLLHRYTGQTDLAVGTSIANRAHPDLEPLIGFLTNTLVLRTALDCNPTFTELLGRIRAVARAAYAHAETPLEQIIEELQPERSMSQNPLFQVCFSLLQAHRDTLRLGDGLELEQLNMDSSMARFDLSVTVEDTRAGLLVAVEYSRDLFEPATIARLLAHYRTLLEAIAAAPATRITKLPLLTPAGRHQLLHEWNNSATPYPREACIHDLFAEAVAKTPDAPAVLAGERQLTYRELDQLSNRLARRLRVAGVGADTSVAVCAERTLEMVVALVAVLKAGGNYLPFDPADPGERLNFLFNQARARLVLAPLEACERIAGVLEGEMSEVRRQTSEVRGQGSESGNRTPDSELPSPDSRLPSPASRPPFLGVDLSDPALLAESAAPLPSVTTPENLAYTTYTSGSTGVPKGICIPHRGVVRLVRNTNYLDYGPELRILELAPVSFDASTFELWGALCNGALLVVLRPGAPSIRELADTIERHRITTLYLTSALFNLMVDERVAAFATVKHLLVGGDIISVPHAKKVLATHPGLTLINGYGPTETTTFASCGMLRKPADVGYTVTIGPPMSNTTLYILDSEMEPAPIGVPGDLYIGGDGNARCYLALPALTAETFIPNPHARTPGERIYRTGDLARWAPDGTIEFLGRRDFQVKIRGFRIELGEIESALAAHPAVKEAMVLVIEDRPGDKRLVACVQPRDTATPTDADLRGHLRSRLPDFMVPAAFVVLAEFPLNVHSKVDRKALRALIAGAGTGPTRAAYEAPKGPVEETIAGLWADVLKADKIGREDSFFDLGGHSLLATQVMWRLFEIFGIELPLRLLFEHPTTAAFATAVIQSVDAAQARPGRAEAVARVHLKVRNLSPEQVAQLLAVKRG
jgi:aspartate racemase